MTIYWPDSTKTIIDDIREAIGRPVIFHTKTVSGCSVCTLDPISNESTDPFCSVCSGLYWIPTYSGQSIDAHITWGHADEMRWHTGGQLFDGDCRVQIEYTDTNVTIVNTTDYVEVDDKKMDIRKTIPRGVKEINRLLLDLVERDKHI
jgi:hypothetical protein